MIFIAYKLCLIEAKSVEPFEGVQQSLWGVDDTNAINTLAQIAKNLMAGGVTVPGAINLFNGKTKFPIVNDGDNYFRIKDNGGNQLLAIGQGGDIYSKDNGFVFSGNDMTVKGNVNIGADLNFPNATTIKSGGRLHVAGEELLYLLNKAGVIVSKAWGGNGNLTVDGDLNVSGRNILAELNELKQNLATIIKDTVKLGQNVSLKPNPDSNRCFDFGSSGRTNCENGWSIGQLVPR